MKIKCSLKTNMESCWYALILQALSIQSYQYRKQYDTCNFEANGSWYSTLLGQICVCPNAQKKTNNLSPIPLDIILDIIKVVLTDPEY